MSDCTLILLINHETLRANKIYNPISYMTQTIIKNKLISYLEIIQSELIDSLKKTSSVNNEQKIKSLETELQQLRSQLKKGHCYGFALLHSAFDAIGKLPWWESALLTIANWDEKSTPLDTLIELPGSEENAFWQTKEEKENAEHIPVNKKEIKLRILLERVLAYIIYHQQENSPLNNEQTTFLSPEHTFFELITRDGNILSIKKREVLAGYFEQKHLEELLSEADFTGSIGLIKNNGHTIRVGFKEGKWLVYDPNYNHCSSNSLHHYFSNKTDLTHEIIRILGHSLAIEVGSFNSKKDFSLLQFDLNHPGLAKKKLQERGLHQIARYTPHSLLNTLNLVARAYKGHECIANALVLQTEKGWSGLHMIAQYSPNTLAKALDLAALAPKGPECIANALGSQAKNGWSGLHMIARYSPGTLAKVLDLATLAYKGRERITQALVSQNKDGWSGLHEIARYSPDTLAKVLDLAALAYKGRERIAQALVSQNKDGWSGARMIHEFAQKSLLAAFEYTTQSLLEVYPQDYFHLIYKYARSLFNVKLYTLLVQSSNKELLARALSELLPQLIEILKCTAPHTPLDTGDLRKDCPELSYANFIKTMEQYMTHKQQAPSFFLNYPKIKPATADSILKLNAATSDVHRYELAQKFINQYPREPLAKLLSEVMKLQLSRHTISLC